MHPSRWMRLAWIVPLTIGAAFIVGFLGVSLRRITYPFALEWMEAGSIDVLQRVLSGQSIYVEPSLDYVPFIYTPGYFYASALLSFLVGGGFLPLRLLSLIATLGTLLCLYTLVRRETGDRAAAFLSAALFAATFGASGAWFDLARVDSLFILLYALSLVVLQSAASRGTFLVAGILLALAFLTKQTALVAALPLFLYVVLYHGRLTIWLAGAFVFAAGLISLVFQRLTGGWYLYYILLPGQDDWSWLRVWQSWTADLLGPFSIALLGGLGALRLFAHRGQWKRFWFWILLLTGALVSSCLARGRSGGYLNVLMPAHLALAASFGLGIHALRSAVSPSSSKEKAAASALPEVLSSLVCVAACLVQFGLLAYDPRQLIPSQEDQAAGWSLVNRLKQVDGDVLLPLHAYLAGMAGKRVYLQGNAGIDTLRAANDPVRNRLIGQFRKALRERQFRLIILDRSGLLQWNRFKPLFGQDLETFYLKAGPLFERGDLFWPVTGMRTRPDDLWLPRQGRHPSGPTGDSGGGRDASRTR